MKSKILKPGLLVMILFMATGCELVGDIFKAGVSVGIFIVIAVIVLIIWLVSRFRK